MNSSALIMFIVSAVLLWGGLGAAVAFYLRKPEVDHYPEGGEEIDRESF
ncbi:MetS family NSS transporter small subunit [Canibacter zhoujuaniae]|nr:MetS family NSS transporter small subunit [Canibacter zhoujuaniae]